MPTAKSDLTTRRRVLKAGFAAAGSVAAIGTAQAADAGPPHGDSTAPSGGTKLSPEAVQYQPTPKDWQKCLFCAYFQAPDTCGIVAGKVSPQGWCTHFALLHE